MFVTAHRREWDRLDELTRHSRSLSGAEVDELVDLYQRTATHLSACARPRPTRCWSPGCRAGHPGRAASSPRPACRPTARSPRSSCGTSRLRCTARGGGGSAPAPASSSSRSPWRAGWRTTRTCRRSIATPEEMRQLVDQDFATYYSSHPAGAFAAQVWTNNAWLSRARHRPRRAARHPDPRPAVAERGERRRSSAALMAAHGRLDLFFGLILPHGLLELTAVFVAAGVGLRLGWTIDRARDRPRGAAVAAEGRAAIGVALGLVAVLLVSGVIEAFVTPSGLPTWARIGIGAVVVVGVPRVRRRPRRPGRARRRHRRPGRPPRGRRRAAQRRLTGSSEPAGLEAAGGLEGQVGVGEPRRQLRPGRPPRRRRRRAAAGPPCAGAPAPPREPAAASYTAPASPRARRHRVHPRVGDRGQDHLVPGGERGQLGQQAVLDRRPGRGR